MNETALNSLLEVIGIASGVASGILSGEAQKGAEISAALVSIVQKTLAAHESVIGQPIDPALVRPFEPL